MASRALKAIIAICLAAAVVVGIGLALPDAYSSGGGAYGESEGADSASEGSASAVTIENFGFSGQTVVAPGATVEVTNSDETQHTLTASDGSFDTGPIDGGSTVTFVAPTEPGTYEFFCEIHPSMTGSLVVQS